MREVNLSTFKLDSNLRYRVVAINDRYHWIDRVTDLPVLYKNGDYAEFDSLDQAIAAFVEGRLTVKMNEPLAKPTITLPDNLT